MYPEDFVKPMREELTTHGFKELTTPEVVNQTIKNNQETLLVVVNSVCGCAAGGARPAVIKSLSNPKKPKQLTTVFAGVDVAAVQQARSYFLPYPPTSPSIALFKDGKLVHFIERHEIEGYSPDMIAENLKSAYNTFC